MNFQKFFSLELVPVVITVCLNQVSFLKIQFFSCPTYEYPQPHVNLSITITYTYIIQIPSTATDLDIAWKFKLIIVINSTRVSEAQKPHIKCTPICELY